MALLFAKSATAQKPVSFPTEDGGVIYADVYGESDRGVVLAHGGRFNKESWEKQAQTLAAAGFRDRRVPRAYRSWVASLGGGAAGDGSIASQRGAIDRLVLLGATLNGPAEKLKVVYPVHSGRR